MQKSALQITPIVSMPFSENTYLVYLEGSNEAIVIDPGLEPAAIVRELKKRKLKVAAILNTHGHADHIAGNAAMKELFPDAPLMIGSGDAAMLTDPALNLSLPFGMPLTSPEADQLLIDGDVLHLAGMTILVRDLPGHSPGHVVFIVQDLNPVLVLAGDTLFEGSIGRSDFPGGSLEQLLSGIRDVLFTLPDDTIVYPGHGNDTRVGIEKETNLFLQ
jgi:hydroxyacylglutathione hydrolase